VLSRLPRVPSLAPGSRIPCAAGRPGLPGDPGRGLP